MSFFSKCCGKREDKQPGTPDDELESRRESLLLSMMSGGGRDKSRKEKRTPMSELLHTERSVESTIPEEEYEVGLNHVVKYLRVDLEKRAHKRLLVAYIPLIVALTMLAWYGRPYGIESYSDALLQTEEIKSLLLHDQLMKAHVEEDLWEWLGQALVKVWRSVPARNCENSLCNPQTDGANSLPIGIALIRQWRVSIVPCGAVAGHVHFALSPCDLSALPCNCSHRYDDEFGSSTPYGQENEFLTDKDLNLPKDPLPLATRRTQFDDTSSQYSIMYSFDTPIDDIIANLTDMRNASWIDPSTRIVSLELLFYNPDSEFFLRSSFYMEFFQTGGGDPGFTIRPPFQLDSFGDSQIITAMSLMTFIFIPILLYWVYLSLELRLATMQFTLVIATGHIFEILHVIVLVMLCFERGVMWNHAAFMTSGFFFEEFLRNGSYGSEEVLPESHLMFNYLSRYNIHWGNYNQWLAVSVILTYLGTFKYLQRIHWLNMLSETAKNAAVTVLTLAFLFMWCVCAFALAAVLLFHYTLSDFETPTNAVSALLRTFFLEHEAEYVVMREMEPLFSPMFWVFFHVICNFLLLNMVTGVIVTTFDNVQGQRARIAKQKEMRYEEQIDNDIEEIRHGKPLAKASLTHTTSAKTRIKHEIKQFFSTKLSSNRQRAILLSQWKAAEQLDIPRKSLRNEYMRRVNVSKDDMKQAYGDLLTDIDIAKIFAGSQSETIKNENQYVLLAQCLAEIGRNVDHKFSILDAKLAGLAAKHEVRNTSTDQIASLLLKINEQAAEIKRLSDIQSTAGARAARGQRLRDLDTEKDHLLNQLAVTEESNIPRYDLQSAVHTNTNTRVN